MLTDTNDTKTVEATPTLVVQDLDTSRSPEEIEAIYSQYGRFTKR